MFIKSSRVYLGIKRQIVQNTLSSYALSLPVVRLMNDDYLDSYEIKLYYNYIKKTVEDKTIQRKLFKMMVQREPYIQPPKSDFTDRIKNFLEIRNMIQTTAFSIIISSS